MFQCFWGQPSQNEFSDTESILVQRIRGKVNQSFNRNSIILFFWFCIRKLQWNSHRIGTFFMLLSRYLIPSNDNPKSLNLTSSSASSKQFRAAISRWIICTVSRYARPQTAPAQYRILSTSLGYKN